MKRAIEADLRFWQKQDSKDAEARRLAYHNVILLLRQQAELHDIAIIDLGLVDYQLPKIDE